MKTRSVRRRNRSRSPSKLPFASSRLRGLRLEMLEERALLSGSSVLAEQPLGEMFEVPADVLPPATYEPGQLLVKLREHATVFPSSAHTAESTTVAIGPVRPTFSLGTLLQAYGATSIEPVFAATIRAEPSSAVLAEEDTVADETADADADREELARWYRVDLPLDVDVEDAVADFEATPQVELAEPNYHWRTADLPDAATDPGYNDQWHLDATNVPDAWQHLDDNGVNPGGSRDVVVAVIDTGVDYNHQDLVANMWINAGEIPGNGIDDDDNGFVDDVHGASVVSDARSHSGDPIDLHGHGTHVAGIVASTAYNALGGVGIGFNVQIMAVRAGQYSGVFAVDDVAEGIMYAVDNGAEVINMSFGGYFNSVIVNDALSIAFSRAVLVAAAGNDAVWTEKAPNVPKLPLYPAALPWVLGVMASDRDGNLAGFTNWDSAPETRYEYEVAAPGSGIYSTLPGDRYAAWSGTSMATPVVSGIAALVRSQFPDRAVYSSRFVMGQIVGNVNGPLGGKPGDPGPIVDAYAALTQFPSPKISLLENWIFDDAEIDEFNDGDGRVDAGETIHLALELMGRWGMAGDVTGTLEARAGVVGPDPYVTMLSDTAEFGRIGPFNTADNGFIYSDEGVIVGVENPFAFSVVPDSPNDHVIPFVLTLTYNNAWDPEDTTVYERTFNFSYVVQRGRDVPRVISEDMELTSDDYWLIGGPVLIEEGATLTIREGTQVQWGGISDDPYNPGPQNGNMVVRGTLLVEGTAESPVSLFPSYLVSGQVTRIAVEKGGKGTLRYTKVRNPEVTGFEEIDHSYFDWDAYSPTITAQLITNTIFHKLRPKVGGRIDALRFDTSLFDAGWVSPYGSPELYNTVFLQDNELLYPPAEPMSFTPPLSADWNELQNVNGPWIREGETFAWLELAFSSSQVAELAARHLGGDLASVRNIEEEQFIHSILSAIAYPLQHFVVGLTDDGEPGVYTWLDGSPVTYTNWAREYPVELSSASRHLVLIADNDAYRDPAWISEWTNVLERPGSVNSGGWLTETYSYLMRLPGEWTREEIREALRDDELIAQAREHHYSRVANNAFLSRLWDPNLDHWMRILGVENAHEGFSTVRGNYWGTTSDTLIDHAILDYYDNFTSARIDYEAPLEHGAETTYPFAEQVLINGVPAETVPTLGGGPATFTVKFNRDMDTSIEPFVTFGPWIPYTDFLLDPDSGGWVDPRTWQATFNVNPMTGDGYHLMRVSGAVADDDPWLVTGYDVGRFRFEVETMGVAAMTLQAAGQEAAVSLSWQQDDFELLAGYNLYRSDSIDGTYQRVNETIIPVGEEAYTDTDVAPAVPMYYQFTVVATDLTESEFSNVASAAALDNVPPVITHAAVTSAPPSRGLRLSAEVTDNVGVDSATIHYRAAGTDDYASVSMVNVSGDQWTATIPGSAVLPPGIEYYLTATDGISTAFDHTPAVPHSVVVDNMPSVSSVAPGQGPAEGGTTVTVAGTLFQDGASVLFGGIPAGDVVVLSENQITSVTPPHFPAMVDVQVVNPDNSQAFLFNGFRYVDQDVVLSLPSMSDDHGAIIQIPLAVSNASGLLAVTTTVTFDPSVLELQGVDAGAMTSGWSLSTDTSTAGSLTVALAGATAVSGEGDLAKLTFGVIGDATSQTVLDIVDAELNGGAITAELSDGLFAVNGLFALSGSVHYYSGSGAVPATVVSLVGAGVHEVVSDENGEFSINEIQTGAYVLAPRKSNDIDDITAYDASLVLQAVVGTRNLSGNQLLAADVDRSSAVTSLDASYILKKSVGLLAVPFPGAGKVWEFVPRQYTYALLNSDLTGQDFTAILIGDVSGSWQPGAVGAQAVGLLDETLLDETLSSTTTLALPEVEGSTGRQVHMALQIEAAGEDVYAADLVLTYDAAELAVSSVIAGSAASGMSFVANTDDPGVIRVALAGAQPLTQDGPLVEIGFHVVGPLASATVVSFASAELNEGAVAATVQDGMVHPASQGSEVVGRHILYNNSAFDGKDSAANVLDDAAIATDKQALLPGQTASFANYTSYSRGINGIMIDVSCLADPEALGTDDFQFKVGNTNDPGNWAPAPSPTSLSVREVDGDGDEVADFNRITVIWPDNTIQKQWLQVTVLATESTGLAEPAVFYFGNAVGETGNSATEAMVTSIDEIGARSNPHILIPAAIDDAYDFDRDSMVTSIDQIIARHNLAVLNVLRLITAPGADAALAQATEQESADPETSWDELDWLYEFAQITITSQPSDNGTSVQEAVDDLLAMYWPWQTADGVNS